MCGHQEHNDKQVMPTTKTRHLAPPTHRVAPAAPAKGASGACAAKVRVAIDGPRGSVLPG